MTSGKIRAILLRSPVNGMAGLYKPHARNKQKIVQSSDKWYGAIEERELLKSHIFPLIGRKPIYIPSIIFHCKLVNFISNFFPLVDKLHSIIAMDKMFHLTDMKLIWENQIDQLKYERDLSEG